MNPTILHPMTPADYGIFAGANDGDIAACTADIQTDSPFGDLAVVGMTDSGEAVLEVHGGPDALGYLTTEEPRFRQTYASMHDAAWALTAYVAAGAYTFPPIHPTGKVMGDLVRAGFSVIAYTERTPLRAGEIDLSVAVHVEVGDGYFRVVAKGTDTTYPERRALAGLLSDARIALGKGAA